MKLGNVLDPVQYELDQRVFRDTTPLPTVVRFVEQRVREAAHRELGVNADELLDLYLAGSLTTYQYSDSSDFDVAVFPAYDHWPKQLDPQMIRELLIHALHRHIDGAFLPGTRHALQFFVQDYGVHPEDLFQKGLRSGWSFQDRKWIIPPERARVQDLSIEMPEMFNRAQQMAGKMEVLLSMDPHAAKELHHQIKKKRGHDHDHGGGDFSEGNIVYKYLSNKGLFDQLGQLALTFPTNTDRISSNDTASRWSESGKASEARGLQAQGLHEGRSAVWRLAQEAEEPLGQQTHRAEFPVDHPAHQPGTPEYRTHWFEDQLDPATSPVLGLGDFDHEDIPGPDDIAEAWRGALTSSGDPWNSSLVNWDGVENWAGQFKNAAMKAGYGMYRDIFDFTADALAKMQRLQQLGSAHKRTASLAALTFLMDSGYVVPALGNIFTGHDDADRAENEFIYLIEGLSDSDKFRTTPMQLADWLREHAVEEPHV